MTVIEPRDRNELLSVILNDDGKPSIIACKLIATWKNVRRYGGGRQRVAERWSRVSGIRLDDVLCLWERLVFNGFVKGDGTVDSVADAFARSVLAKQLPQRRAPSPPKPHTPVEGGTL